MKRNYFFLLSFLFLISVLNAQNNETEIKVTLNGFEFELSNIQTAKNSEILKEGLLKSSATIKIGENEIKLRTGKTLAYTFENSQISYAYLDEDTKLKMGDQEFVFLGGSKISFATSYKGVLFIVSACLAQNATIKSGDVQIAAKALKSENDFDIIFNKNGEVTALFLEKEAKFKIGNKDFSFAPNSKLSVDNGSVRSGILAKTQLVNVNDLYKINVKGEKNFASTIEFDYSGRISMVYCTGLNTIKVGGQNISLKQDNYVSFDSATGKIKFAYLGMKSQLKVDGKMKTVDAGKQLEFDSNGNIIVAK
ncbi:MAG TPA: hypothetical protein DEH02_15725 [Bacteroidales bacterium]|nr:MAG: hypothetical protein A2X01_08825 [Bacteroidetes bacterium GWF2_35_48]OFY97465.1 MAG: hypothetical protein A2491_04470 [Bacteroidetes bacterium RIFOXYC12_FULL_35_7]HBX52512.1 hypothetical protein [Bacteroidales bacterium]